jgi:hypothetical protein
MVKLFYIIVQADGTELRDGKTGIRFEFSSRLVAEQFLKPGDRVEARDRCGNAANDD